jgi:hypothetical protein
MFSTMIEMKLLNNDDLAEWTAVGTDVKKSSINHYLRFMRQFMVNSIQVYC